MEEKASVSAKRTVQRSPNYPAITLEKALERARVFWNHEKRNPANITVALRHWGYGPNSGGGRTLVGALLGFGVLRDEGAGDKRQLRLSDAAIRILLDDRPQSEEREAALQELALTPKVYSDILARWPSLDVSDANLRHYLLVERKFNDNTVQEFIKDFRATMEYAKLPLEPGNRGSGRDDDEPSTIRVGDFVSWESNGVLQFEAKRVAWVKDGYAGVEGSSTGLPLAELEVVQAPQSPIVPAPPPMERTQAAMPPIGAPPQKGVGMRQEVFVLTEGDVTIQWPERLSADSFDDFSDWLKILERKIKRGVIQSTPSSPQQPSEPGDDLA